MSTRRVPAPKLKWFGVKTLFRTAAEGRPAVTDGAYDPRMTLVEERVVLYHTSTATNAMRAAEADARTYARDTHLNPYGQRVVTRYLGACDVYELFEPPGHRQEVFSTTEVVSKKRSDKSVIDQRTGPTEAAKAYRSRRNILNQKFSGVLHETSNHSMNPTAGGRRPPRSRDGRSPAAGYAGR